MKDLKWFWMVWRCFSSKIEIKIEKINWDKSRIIYGARRYGISLRVFNSIAHEWDVELNTRRKIPYLQANMYYFVYHITAIALYWEKKPTSLMNENKWVDSLRITIVKCVGANSKDRKMRCIENREGFAAHSSTWPSGAKDEWHVSSWLAISAHVKKYHTFSRVLLRLLSGPGIPV